jgi:hypothetical protein
MMTWPILRACQPVPMPPAQPATTRGQHWLNQPLLAAPHQISEPIKCRKPTGIFRSKNHLSFKMDTVEKMNH